MYREEHVVLKAGRLKNSLGSLPVFRGYFATISTYVCRMSVDRLPSADSLFTNGVQVVKYVKAEHEDVLRRTKVDSRIHGSTRSSTRITQQLGKHGSYVVPFPEIFAKKPTRFKFISYGIFDMIVLETCVSIAVRQGWVILAEAQKFTRNIFVDSPRTKN
ncbi:hypothetical protein CSKR_109760 [Clonorchis sinensis]|uniref:Uncharacterized protein n=1 Tax=Clonorchis sinensis TaxID=79923 RepID=A0A419QD98_CLOSI|nr:hypothetical protein CSKR_109760 [Clonorchis sinensis]